MDKRENKGLSKGINCFFFVVKGKFGDTVAEFAFSQAGLKKYVLESCHMFPGYT